MITSPLIRSGKKFKKKDRRFHEMLFFLGPFAVVICWNDNALVTMVSNNLGGQNPSALVPGAPGRTIDTPRGPRAEHHQAVQHQHGGNGQAGPERQSPEDLYQKKKVALLCCDLAPGQSSPKCLTAASEKCWDSFYPELQEGDHTCHPEGLGRGPHLDPLWGPDFVVIQQNIHRSASTRDVRLGARPAKSATEVSVLTISRNTTLQLRPNLSGLHLNYAEPTDIIPFRYGI